MTQPKERLTAGLAIFVMVSGVVLAFLSFFMHPQHEVADSVLWYVSQCMLYSGALITGRLWLWKALANISDEINRTLHTRGTDEERDRDRAED